MFWHLHRARVDTLKMNCTKSELAGQRLEKELSETKMKVREQRHALEQADVDLARDRDLVVRTRSTLSSLLAELKDPEPTPENENLTMSKAEQVNGEQDL